MKFRTIVNITKPKIRCYCVRTVSETAACVIIHRIAWSPRHTRSARRTTRRPVSTVIPAWVHANFSFFDCVIVKSDFRPRPVVETAVFTSRIPAFAVRGSFVHGSICCGLTDQNNDLSLLVLVTCLGRPSDDRHFSGLEGINATKFRFLHAFWFRRTCSGCLRDEMTWIYKRFASYCYRVLRTRAVLW